MLKKMEHSSAVTAGTSKSQTESMMVDHVSTKRVQISDDSGDSDDMDALSDDSSGRLVQQRRKKSRNTVLIANTSSCSKTRTVSSLDNTLSQSKLIDDAIDTVISQGRSSNMTDIPTDLIDGTDMAKQIAELKIVVSNQNAIIETITKRLNFLLSMFNIDELPICSVAKNNTLSDIGWPALSSVGPSNKQATTSGDIEHTASATSTADDKLSSKQKSNSKQHKNESTHISGQQMTPLTDTITSATLGQATIRTKLPSPQTLLKNTVLSAIIADTHEKQIKRKNVVISGLVTQVDKSDELLFSELCENELGVKPEIKFCRRLGVELPGRVQPLLVGLTSYDQAEAIISCARQLRSSADEHIRQKVYINAQQTKAESQAAYELRCQRRRAANSKNKDQSAAASSKTFYRTVNAHRHEESMQSSVPSDAPTDAVVTQGTI